MLRRRLHGARIRREADTMAKYLVPTPLAAVPPPTVAAPQRQAACTGAATA